MNTVDVYTRAKVNKIHLERMGEEAEVCRLLHKARQGRDLKGARWLMNIKYLFILLILLVSLLGSGSMTVERPNK